ncbi:hypothetical protein N0V83_007234 [Neocucurbitaria cava]|uniref:Uncharacterized protein n=1 Tax=Neocucurbitaria cava TaxID=798079 RepID=A0A9W9CKU7_9PLEO|nr:hypothetical protein N0V83_007234 [Neocucurbitaria cava]
MYEKDGLMIAWRDTSVAAVKRRNEIAEQEAAEARSGAGEDKMLKRMAKRAQEEAEAKKAIEAKRAAAAAAMEKKDTTPPAASASANKDNVPTEEGKIDSPVDEMKKEDEAKKDSEEPKVEAAPAPIKLGFSLKSKTLPQNKASPGHRNVFKRKKDDALEQKPVKKFKL